MNLRFLGGAETVTGSKTLLTLGHTQILVDCGLFQGFKSLRERNWQRLQVQPAAIEAVVLTHAHLDHSGWLPRLVKQGFSGPVYCTSGTADLAQILLVDSGRIHEEDAVYANKRGYSKHEPALPLYTEEEARRALKQLRPVAQGETVRIGPASVSFHPVGHILGASAVLVDDGEARLLFSGDLGRSNDLIMRDPAPPPPASHVILESTYGGRSHHDKDLLTELSAAVRQTAERKGVLLIPSFAVGRSQAVLYALHVLKQRGEIPDLPLVLDSPMAVDTTQVYRNHAAELRISPGELEAMCRGVEFVRATEDSIALADRSGPFVLVSASGMLTGGRVLHHLRRLAPERKNTVLFVGYQAPGTRGRRMLEGEQTVRIHGTDVEIACQITQIDGFSAHADRDELVNWLSQLPEAPRKLWLNHGESASVDALRQQIHGRLGWEARSATEGVEWTLSTHEERRLPSLAAVNGSPSFVPAHQDLALLDSDDMRSVRLMLEFQKVESALTALGIEGTVVIFGSTRITSDTDHDGLSTYAYHYEDARRLAQLISEKGELGGQRVAVVTGGGPGIMEAANRGAFERKAPSIGLNIALPHEQGPNRYVTPNLAFQFRYFGMRKLHFMLRARALVAYPGGFGTLDEVFETLCLIQTKKLQRLPVVLINRAFWTEILDLDKLVADGFINQADADLVTLVDTAQEAWDRILTWYA